MAAKEFRNDPRRERLQAASKPAVVQPVKPVAIDTKVETKADIKKK
jgi:hypothetical protein